MSEIVKNELRIKDLQFGNGVDAKVWIGREKNSYVSAVAGGQKKSHPGGRDCFFFGFFEIKTTFYNLH